MGLGAAIIGGVLGATSLASGVMGSNAATDAAQVQSTAANKASDNQLAMFATTQANLKPFITAGTGAQDALSKLTGTNPGGNPLTAPLTAKFDPTIAQLESTPGYQFTLDQGLKATQNSYAAQGLGTSGAAMKGATNYAEGLAGTTFQQQFDNYLRQNSQIYNLISGQANLGENAAAGAGALGQSAVTQAGNFATSGAAATGAGIVGGTNALTAGLNNTAGLGLLYANTGSGLFGPSGSSTPGLTTNTVRM